MFSNGFMAQFGLKTQTKAGNLILHTRPAACSVRLMSLYGHKEAAESPSVSVVAAHSLLYKCTSKFKEKCRTTCMFCVTFESFS